MPQQIADHIRRRIVSGDLPTGSRLPSLRKLARLFDVSLPTMHSAIHALVALGLIRVSHGVGTFVTQPADGTAVMHHAWLRASSAELAAMRGILDERLAQAAAQRVAKARPNRMPRTLDAIHLFAHERSGMKSDYPETFLRADAAFHRMIAASVRGFEISAELRERIDLRLHPRFMAVADVLAADDNLHRQHIELAAAVMDGEPIRAAALARRIAAAEGGALGYRLG